VPLFRYKCEDCAFSKEHFFFPNSEKILTCPLCSSERYKRAMSKFLFQMEYADNEEYMEKKIDPMVNEMFENVGKEAMSESTKTLENFYGSEVVESSIVAKDD